MGFGERYVGTLLLFVENELYHQIGIDFVVEAYEMYMYIWGLSQGSVHTLLGLTCLADLQVPSIKGAWLGLLYAEYFYL